MLGALDRSLPEKLAGAELQKVFASPVALDAAAKSVPPSRAVVVGFGSRGSTRFGYHEEPWTDIIVASMCHDGWNLVSFQPR